MIERLYQFLEMSNGKPKLASDIYAVGMIGIQALTGLSPHKLQENTDTGEIIWRNQVSVSDRLGNILSTMVRYHPKERYQNASEALKALIPSPKFLKLWPVLGGLVITAIASFALINRPSPPTIQPQFNQLENNLAAGKWKEADEETLNLMLKITGKDNINKLSGEDIENLPCEHLITIDKLWEEYSSGHFGFRVQTQIYLETGNKLGEYEQEAYTHFAERVGWKEEGGDWKPYSSYTFTLNAPYGHLPSSGEWKRVGTIAEKFAECNI